MPPFHQPVQRRSMSALAGGYRCQTPVLALVSGTTKQCARACARSGGTGRRRRGGGRGRAVGVEEWRVWRLAPPASALPVWPRPRTTPFALRLRVLWRVELTAPLGRCWTLEVLAAETPPAALYGVSSCPSQTRRLEQARAPRPLVDTVHQEEAKPTRHDAVDAAVVHVTCLL